MSSSQCAGDKFDEKYNLYANMLYRLCMVYLKNHAGAEDAMQDIFITLIYKSPAFKTAEDEKRWLVRVAVNICKDRLKSSWSKKTIPMDNLENHEGIGLYENTNEIFQLVQNLPEKYRTVISLYYTEGFSVEDISKILGIGQSAVKMRLKRSRDMLKVEMEDN